nr:CGNR zinc finger domain-containing protein [Streptomyces antimycoticus]
MARARLARRRATVTCLPGPRDGRGPCRTAHRAPGCRALRRPRSRASAPLPGPNCLLFFVKHHARREWCSPACGNRVRVARHYRRHHTGPQS